MDQQGTVRVGFVNVEFSKFFHDIVTSIHGEWIEGTQFIRSRFVLILYLFQIILQLMLEIIDLNITSLRSERSSSRKGSDQY